MSLENVKTFYRRLASDEAFRTQIQGVRSKDECSQIVKGAGYDFTQEEYEEYTAQLLESSATEGELRELGEKELEAVFGGASSLIVRPPIMPMYGLPQPIDSEPQPLPPIQPMYGLPSLDLL